MAEDCVKIEKALQELRAAERLKRETQTSLDAARSADTNAMNALNAAQKNLDALYSELKKSAPAGSDWKSR